MKDKRVVGIFGAGFLIAAALGGIYFWVEDIHPMSGDDDRVVVAGGSLKIGSVYGFDPDLSDPQKANHKHKGRTVNRLEIWTDDNAARTDQFYVSGQVDVDIEYCPDAACLASSKNDHVTLTAPGGKKLKVSNTDTIHPIGDEAKLNPLLIDHRPSQGRVKQIVISGKLDHTPQPSYACAASGKCHVVLHYWCPTDGDGDCTN